MSARPGPADLHRAKELVRVVRERGTLRDDEAADILGCSMEELRAAIGIAMRWRRLDQCSSWLVPTSSRREGRPAA